MERNARPLGISHEKRSLIEQIGRMYSAYFGVPVRRSLSYQWQRCPAFELRRIYANWEALMHKREAKQNESPHSNSQTLFNPSC
jgi:hypothetical protein